MATLHVGPSDGVASDGVDGRVGIGTSNPNEKLVISGDNARVMNKGVTNTAFNAVHAQNSDGDGAEMVAYGRNNSGTYLGQNRAGAAFLGGTPNSFFGIGTRNNTPVVLGTSDAERMRITPSGNIGIGTSNPTVKFEVNGNVKAGNFITSDGISGATADVDVSRPGGGTRRLQFKNGLFVNYIDL